MAERLSLDRDVFYGCSTINSSKVAPVLINSIAASFGIS